ncbi:MAG TPA: LLM class flavin-dependent oxidoreductase [Acidimicrobiia bacterium]|jgi:5,10-methylenetetrahydromethanopterin reductase
MEVWLHSFSWAHRVAPAAAAAERMGFDGFLLADSQNLNADIWVELALAGAATGRIALGPGVTNTETRDPAVTASAAATLHAETNGRAVLALGRGDSALSQLGREPIALERFEVGLTQVQAYLRGEQVDRDGTANGIRWVPDLGLTKVPVAVAASGPRVIGLAARHADRIDFTVGAEPERVRWAVATARAVNPHVSLGAFVNVAVHRDRAVARDLVRGSTAILARFSASVASADGLSSATRSGIARLAGDYDPARHAEAAAPAAQRLEDEFVDRFAAVGTAAEVTERLAALASEGLDRVIVVAGSLDADAELVERSDEDFAASVLPALHTTA